jgi:hypothetical protein
MPVHLGSILDHMTPWQWEYLPADIAFYPFNDKNDLLVLNPPEIRAFNRIKLCFTAVRTP